MRCKIRHNVGAWWLGPLFHGREVSERWKLKTQAVIWAVAKLQGDRTAPEDLTVGKWVVAKLQEDISAPLSSGVLWKGPRAMRAMRGNTLETVPFQPYFGCTESFLQVLLCRCCQATRPMRAKQVVTIPFQPHFGFHRVFQGSYHGQRIVFKINQKGSKSVTVLVNQCRQS